VALDSGNRRDRFAHKGPPKPPAAEHTGDRPELHVALGMDSAYPVPSTGEAPLNERVEPFMKLGQDKFA